MRDYLVTVKTKKGFVTFDLRAKTFCEAERLAIIKPEVIYILQLILMN